MVARRRALTAALSAVGAIAIVVVVTIVLPRSAGNAPLPQPIAPIDAAAPDSVEILGAESCATCHRGVYAAW
ncbi:MAG: hypothetical protein AABZ80_02290, partial [Gemmatimonadota bacterium]